MSRFEKDGLYLSTGLGIHAHSSRWLSCPFHIFFQEELTSSSISPDSYGFGSLMCFGYLRFHRLNFGASINFLVVVPVDLLQINYGSLRRTQK